MPRILTLLALAVALAFAACGGDGDAAAESEATPEAAAAQTATPEGADLGDTSTKPEIPAPEGEPPSELVVEDIVEGTGRTARPGDTVSVQYVGVSHSTGEEFDASWDRGQPFEFQLGAGQVIPGWDEGVAGMKVGGRRKLVIPPDMAYGAAGAPPAIGPDETLVFVVDLLDVKK